MKSWTNSVWSERPCLGCNVILLHRRTYLPEGRPLSAEPFICPECRGELYRALARRLRPDYQATKREDVYLHIREVLVLDQLCGEFFEQDGMDSRRQLALVIPGLVERGRQEARRKYGRAGNF